MFNKFCRGILAYSTSYEGHPITDDIVLDTERILEDISKMETDKIAEDFLEMHIKPDSSNCYSVGDKQCHRFHNIAIEEVKQTTNTMETNSNISVDIADGNCKFCIKMFL